MEHQKKIRIQAILAGFAALLLLVGLDQWTKALAVEHLAGQRDIDLIPGVLTLHYLENRGAAFGILQNQQWIFVLIAAVFFLAATAAYWKMPKTRHYLPMHILAVTVTAGAVGNVLDRVRLNYVVDFVYISLINFPVFNVADIYVTVSAVLFFIYVIFYYKEEDFQFLKKRER
ncbi:signal peptidase II [Lactonifactor longoviformis]|uniref:Lipoprotein signal peptidase n=1 Tax=Lactonifactor longoviformis DSM 17459 TaxID=1122155 RepID=A0A1M4ZLH4_9CLOT|nr:signal peptidase II [Lactonifactor longoviformis]POP32593.1 signal peptidase II [Lactonifactor longoviformis]SHF18805.1 signal peptidase II [Lactonifactor longoviformis DSM 17459]